MDAKNFIRFYKSEKARKAVTQSQLKEIRKIYKKANKEIKKKQKDLLAKVNKTQSDALKKLYLDSFKKEMESELTHVNTQVQSIVKNGALKAAKVVVVENNEMLKKMGIFIEGAFSYVPTNAVQQIVTGAIYNGKWTLSKAIWSDNKKTINTIENIVAQGITTNKPTREIANELVSYSNSGNASYNAMRLAKTMTSHAYQKAYQMTTQSNPFVEYYQWNNGHSSNICPLCIDLATKDMFGLGAGIFPKNEIPLDHPNGQCFITSVISDANKIDDALINWVNDTGDPDMNKQLDKFANDMGFLPQTVKSSVKIK
jgi:uncharacterized protein YnzC (UPF0291/DUF896 family)